GHPSEADRPRGRADRHPALLLRPRGTAAAHVGGEPAPAPVYDRVRGRPSLPPPDSPGRGISGMWTVVGSRDRHCDGGTRRTCLRGGALPSGGLPLPGLWRGAARAASPAAEPARSAILVYLGGGPSHFETFDPKPDAPAEIRGPYRPTATSVPGVSVSETLP